MRRAPLVTVCVAALTAVCLLAPTPVAAQDDTLPLLWVSYVAAQPGKSNQLSTHLATSSEELYAGLIADGYVLNRGVAQAVNHFPSDDWTHLEWVNFRDWAAVGEFANRFIAAQRAMSDEEQAADAAKWAELVVPGSHHDEVVQTFSLAAGAGRPGYIAVSYFDAKPMAEDQVKGLYDKWRAPMMDQLMADGAILGHGAFAKALHGSGSGWEIGSWFSMADLAGMDAVMKADTETNAARSAEDMAAFMAEVGGVMDLAGGNHSDRILVVIHYQAGAPPADG